MSKDMNANRLEKEILEQKLESLLLRRLQNNAVIEFNISEVKADFKQKNTKSSDCKIEAKWKIPKSIT